MSCILESLLRRTRTLRIGEENRSGPIVYWMSRDQRVHDNYALLMAIEQAKRLDAPVAVIFCLVDDFLNATATQFYFMLKGLMESAAYLSRIGIPFFLLKGNPSAEIPEALHEMKATVLITDFDPLKVKRQWKREVILKTGCSVYEVDAHNIVPCFYASDRLEFSAFTFRKKINDKIPDFLTDIPEPEGHLPELKCLPVNTVPIEDALLELETRFKGNQMYPLKFFKPGYSAGMQVLQKFITEKLEDYSKKKNDVLADVESCLSPYIHFGQISAQRVALAVKNSGCNPESIDQFLEQLIIRREIADNFCYYNPDYDLVNGFPFWARQTLFEHIGDKREYVHTPEEFENAKTNDEIWNCAQMELKMRGKIHNYLRMYWGKKILEWSADPETALQIGNDLNNKYALDGRDPNGYVGVAWCIGGVHDRPFAERKVFGKIRYMGKAALERNFDVGRYIERINLLISSNRNL